MIEITPSITLYDSEIRFTFITSPGPGGQNVNKVATGVLLRFNVWTSPTLSEEVRTRLLLLIGKKITNQGEILIKATRYRTQERNKQDALNRLIDLIKRAAIPPKKRKKTRPSRAAKQKRLDSKKLHSNKKNRRRMSNDNS